MAERITRRGLRRGEQPIGVLAEEDGERRDTRRTDAAAPDGIVVTGTVEALSLRVTSVRQFDGTLSVVPNGSVKVSRNKTRGWGRAIIDVRVAVDEDVARVKVVIDELLEELSAQEGFESALRKNPEILGVVQVTDIAQVIRVAAETEPSRRLEIERELRERMTARLSERGIRVPPVPVQPRTPEPSA